MREKIDCFLPCDDLKAVSQTVSQLRGSKTVQNICLLVSAPLTEGTLADCPQLQVDNLTSSNTLMSIAENAKADYVLLQTRSTRLLIGEDALDRMLRIASDSDAVLG